MVPCGFRFLDVGKWPPSLLRPNIAVSLVLFRRNVPYREGDRKFLSAWMFRIAWRSPVAAPHVSLNGVTKLIGKVTRDGF